jgi:hypothetical protein
MITFSDQSVQYGPLAIRIKVHGPIMSKTDRYDSDVRVNISAAAPLMAPS